MIPSGLVVGYHGCTRAVAEAVALGTTQLRPSRNHSDWLGHGIYFWLDDPHRAWDWAVKSTRRQGEEPAVLGAVIEPGLCLVTSQLRFCEMLSGAHQELVQTFETAGLPLPKNQGKGWANRRLDCAVFEHLHQTMATSGERPFDTVVGYFPEGGALYPGAAVRRFDHIQICVRNPDCLVGCFLARPEDQTKSLA